MNVIIKLIKNVIKVSKCKIKSIQKYSVKQLKPCLTWAVYSVGLKSSVFGHRKGLLQNVSLVGQEESSWIGWIILKGRIPVLSISAGIQDKLDIGKHTE